MSNFFLKISYEVYIDYRNIFNGVLLYYRCLAVQLMYNDFANTIMRHSLIFLHTKKSRKLNDNAPKEIEIIHRLFLVIAMYCPASSMNH